MISITTTILVSLIVNTDAAFASIDNTVYSELDAPFQLEINQTARIGSEDLQIELLKIIEDSRCEYLYGCGPYGTVSALVQVKDDKDQRYLAVSTDKLHHITIPSVDSYLIQMQAVDPFPIHGNVTDSDYRVTFIVSKRDSNWKTYELSGGFLAENHTAYQEFRIPYKITNVELNKITVSQDNDGSLVAEIKNATVPGKFDVVIPRNLFDSKMGNLNVDDSFFVLVNGREGNFDEISTSCFRSLSIKLDSESKKIEIVGTNLLMGPEPVMSEVLPVNVRSDRLVYSKGDKMTISGCTSLNMKPDEVEIEILNQARIIKTATVVPNPDGTFFYAVAIDDDFDYGYYTVRATFAGNTALEDFSVKEGSTESLVDGNIQKFLLTLKQVGPIPLSSDIRKSMCDTCSSLEGGFSKDEKQFWQTLHIKLLSNTPEFKYFDGKISSITEESVITATSCPPLTSINGTFTAEMEEKHKFELQYDGNTFRYKIYHDVQSPFSQSQPSLEDQLKQARQNIEPVKMVDGAIISPLKQFKSGILAENVQCKEGLQLVIKAKDDSPACVKPETKLKLIERGWAIDDKTLTKFPQDLTFRIESAGSCSWMYLDKIPPNGLIKRKDWFGTNALILKIGDEELNQASHLKEMINAMASASGFKPDEYEENVIAKQIAGTEADHSEIFAWLKANFDKQYGLRSDGSFSSFFQYNDNTYAVRWALC